MGNLSFLDDEKREWIDWRWGWLDKHIGAARMRAAKVPVSTAELVQGDSMLTEDSARALVDRICQAMGMHDQPVRVIFSREEADADDPEHLAEFDAAVKEKTHLVIGFNTGFLGKPHQAVIQFYPAIAYAYLQRHSAMDPPPIDQRLLCELAAIQFGGGALLANNEIVTSRTTHSPSLIYTEETLRLSDLTTQGLGYALARFAYDRQEQSPEWGRKLRADPKGFYKRSLAALKTEPPETRDQPPQWYTDAEQGIGTEEEDWSPEELAAAYASDFPDEAAPIYCRSCGYRLDNLPPGDCPECGQPFDPEDLRTVSLEKSLPSEKMDRAAESVLKWMCVGAVGSLAIGGILVILWFIFMVLTGRPL